MALNLNALCTLAQAKAHLGIPIGEVLSDPRLELFINAASSRIESYCDRKIVDQGLILEVQHGRRSNILLPREFPILTVTEISIDSDGLFTDPTKIVPVTDYQIADNKTSLVFLHRHAPNGYNNVRISYTAGYVTAPSDLTLACIWMLEWFELNRNRKDMGRSGAGKGDENYTVLTSMPKMIEEILDDYKRTEMPLLNSPVSNL